MQPQDKALRMYKIGDMPSFRMYVAELTRAESMHLVKLMAAMDIPKPREVIWNCREDIIGPDTLKLTVLIGAGK